MVREEHSLTYTEQISTLTSGVNVAVYVAPICTIMVLMISRATPPYAEHDIFFRG